MQQGDVDLVGDVDPRLDRGRVVEAQVEDPVARECAGALPVVGPGEPAAGADPASKVIRYRYTP